MSTPQPGRYLTKPLTRETWPDFAALVEANNGVWGGCWCIGFHPEGVGRDSTVAGNRDAKLAHVTNGTVHQVLVYRDGHHVPLLLRAVSLVKEVRSALSVCR